jgi:hypothetical protein
MIQHVQASQARVSPNYDFYNDFFSFTPVIWAPFLQIFQVFFIILITDVAPIAKAPYICAPYTYMCVLISIVVCKDQPKSRRTQSFVRRGCFICFLFIIRSSSIIVLTPALFGIGWFVGIYFLACALPCCIAYLGLAILDEWRIRRAGSASPTIPRA